LAKMYRFEKKYEIALKYYSREIALSGETDAYPYIVRAETYLLAGKAKESLEDAQIALKRKPQSVSAMVARANANIALGQPAKALPDLNFAIRLQPESGTCLLLRAKAYELLGEDALAANDRKTAGAQSKRYYEDAPFRAQKGRDDGRLESISK
jgi:tetratricopeptide (TPR) repeat protein